MWIRDIVDRHKGEKALVCGTGTSINQFPQAFYQNFDGFTVGVDYITYKFEPDYYISLHKDHPGKMKIITGNNVLARKKGGFYQFNYNYPFHKLDVEKRGKLCLMNTCALTALSLAYQLGATVLYLNGIDFCRGENGENYFKEAEEAVKPEPVYDAKGELKNFYLDKENRRWRQNLDTFSEMFDDLRANGVQVFNLSKISKLENIEPAYKEEVVNGLVSD